MVSCSEKEAHMVMELNAVVTNETGKGASIRIWNALRGGIDSKDSQIDSQKIKVFIKKPSESDKEKEKADVEIAKKIQQNAYRIARKHPNQRKEELYLHLSASSNFAKHLSRFYR